MPPSPERLRRPATARRTKAAPGGRPRIVLFTAKRDWHARTLLAALARHGVSAAAMPLERCAFDTNAPNGLRIGVDGRLPDGVLVRTVSAGSFEAITRRLGILHALGALGVPVWNGASAIERCVDKSATSFLLKRAGLPVPPSWAVEGLDAARAVVEAHAAAGPLVLKPLFGSQGRGVMLIRSPADLPAPESVAEVYYLQRFVGGAGPQHRDYRILAVDGEPAAAMARTGASWITNVRQGAAPTRIGADRELADLAVRAAAAVGAWFCGVDIIRGPDGALHVLEVNSMPAWSGLQTVVDVDIADLIAARLAERLSAAALPQVA